MNCREFQSNVDGLARGALLDARARDEAAAHEAACEACAARLADERALTAGLRALAATMCEAAAPARSESALLAAFRSRASVLSKTEVAAPASSASPTKATLSTSRAAPNVVSLSERAGAKPWTWVKTLAVASAAAAAAVALFMLVPPTPTPAPGVPPQSAKSRPQSAPTVQTAQTGAGATPNETANAGDSHGYTSSENAGSQESKSVDEDEPARAPGQRRAPVRAMNAGYNRGGGLTAAASRDGGALASQAANVDEVTTDFIPLMQGAAFTQTEAARLVRVEIPRAALAQFGIPLNGEHAGGRVKADLLLGEDGTARAIRFVR